MDHSELVSISEASRRLGISRMTIRRRIDEGRLPEYRSDLNAREHLVRIADVERLREPVLIKPERTRASDRVRA